MLGERARSNLYFLGLPIVLGFLASLISNFLLSEVPTLNALSVQSTMSLSPKQTQAKDSRLLVVEIEPDTVRKLGLPETVDRVPRDVHANLVRDLDKAGASVVFFDLLFRKPQPESDKVLRDALASLKQLKVVLATKAVETEPQLAGVDPDTGKYQFEALSVWDQVWTTNVHIGSTNNITRDDGVTVGSTLLQEDVAKKEPILHAVVSAIVLHSGVSPSEHRPTVTGDVLSVDYLKFKLNLPGNNGVETQFTAGSEPIDSIEYSELISRLKRGEGDLVKGKLLLIGLVGSTDIVQLANGDQIDGVHYMAHTLNTVLKLAIDQTESLSPLLTIFLSTLLASASCWLLVGRPARRFFVVLPLALVVGGVGIPMLLSAAGYRSDPLLFGVSILLAVCLLGVCCGLLGEDIKLRPAGAIDSAVVMFLDIKDSTPLVESIGAVRYQDLNTRLNRVNDATVRKHGGVIERTTGDGFFAVFRQVDRFLVSRDLLDLAEELIQTSRQTFEGLDVPYEGSSPVTIGVEMGPLTGGYVREGGHHTWSSAGLAVNVAQRAQSVCKSRGCAVIFGPSIGAIVHQHGDVQNLGPEALKGIAHPTNLYGFDPTHHRLKGETGAPI